MKAILFLALCASLSASTMQPILATTGTATLTTSGTNYVGIGAVGGLSWGEGATPAGQYFIAPTNGVLKWMCFRGHASPGAAKSYTWSVYKNGANSLLSVVMTGASGTSSTQQCDMTDVVRLAPGDLAAYQIVAAGTPTAISADFWVTWVPDIPNETILFSSANSVTVSTFYAPLMNVLDNGTENTISWPMAMAGTVKNLYGLSSTIAGGTATWTFTFDLNSSGQTLSVAQASGGSTSVVSDTNQAHNVTVSAGNTVSFHIIAASSPASTALYISAVFVPTVPGQFPIAAARNASPTSGASTLSYSTLTGRITTWVVAGSEGTIQQAAPAMQLRAIYALVVTAPGGSASWAVSVRQNAGNTTGLAATISGAATTANATGATVNIAQWDLLNIQSLATTSPTGAGTMLWSVAGYIAPTDSHFFSAL